MGNEASFADQMARMGELLGDLERAAPPDTLERVRDLVRALLDVHAEALGAMVEAAPPGVREAWVADPRVASVLVMHGCHPMPLEARARAALEELGGAAEVLGVDDGAVLRVRVRNPAARRAAEEALCRATPDAVLEFDEVEPGASGFVPASRLTAGRGA